MAIAYGDAGNDCTWSQDKTITGGKEIGAKNSVKKCAKACSKKKDCTVFAYNETDKRCRLADNTVKIINSSDPNNIAGRCNGGEECQPKVAANDGCLLGQGPCNTDWDCADRKHRLVCRRDCPYQNGTSCCGSRESCGKENKTLKRKMKVDTYHIKPEEENATCCKAYCGAIPNYFYFDFKVNKRNTNGPGICRCMKLIYPNATGIVAGPVACDGDTSVSRNCKCDTEDCPCIYPNVKVSNPTKMMLFPKSGKTKTADQCQDRCYTNYMFTYFKFNKKNRRCGCGAMNYKQAKINGTWQAGQMDCRQYLGMQTFFTPEN